MATIKSYTDLEQSKKLAEILPLESADMHSEAIEINGDMVLVVVCGLGDKNKSNYGSPIWSLAALLELLPKRIEIVDNVYELSVYLCGIYYWNTINGNLCFESKDKDNLVDACYEMMLKLNELNLL